MLKMNCALCGIEFKIDDADSACNSCPMHKGCQMIRCPNCGYDNLPEPKIAKEIKKQRKAKNETK